MTEQNRFETHFTDRWRERGDPRYDSHKLQQALMAAHRQIRENGISPVLEFVIQADKRGSEPCGFYRFLIEGVPYYVVIAEHTSKILTLYDQDMMRMKKELLKRMKIKRSKATLGGKIRRKKIAEARRKANERTNT